MAVTIDSSQCVGCGACVMECVHEALTLEQEGVQILVKVAVERCTDCGACVAQCPLQIIHLPDQSSLQAAPSTVDRPPLDSTGSDAEEPASEHDSLTLRGWRPGQGQVRRRLRRRLRRNGDHRSS